MPYIFVPNYDKPYEQYEGIRLFEERTQATAWIANNVLAENSAMTAEELNPHHMILMEFFHEGGSAEIGRLLYAPLQSRT